MRYIDFKNHRYPAIFLTAVRLLQIPLIINFTGIQTFPWLYGVFDLRCSIRHASSNGRNFLLLYSVLWSMRWSPNSNGQKSRSLSKSLLYNYTSFTNHGSIVSVRVYISFLIRAAIVLCFINYQLYYESLTSKDPSIGVIPQFQLSSREFQHGMTEILNVHFLFISR